MVLGLGLGLGASSPGLSPGRGHCVVFLDKTLNSHSASLHPGVNCWGNLTNCRDVTCDGLSSHPGGVEILLAASCYRNRDKLLQGFTVVHLHHFPELRLYSNSDSSFSLPVIIYKVCYN